MRKIMVIERRESAITSNLKQVFPLMGEPVFYPERIFLQETDSLELNAVFDFMQHFGEPAVLFTNPYGNADRLRIYQTLRLMGQKCISFERGALPDSWFFDDKGFNFSSSNYKQDRWDFPMTTGQARRTKKYIARTLKGANTLEKQGARVGARIIKDRLEVGNKKLVFVPLQRPSDTVTRYFAGVAQSCDAFLAAIDATAEMLSDEYLFVCKRHPLEVQSPALRHAIYAPDDTHFLDLLDACDAVALINSGVGVYAMMAQKPCLVFGDAFYQHEGLNVRASCLDPKHIAERLTSIGEVDAERALRFSRYLIEDFYSFGKAQVHERLEKDGSLRSITTGIDFYDITIPCLGISQTRSYWH